MAGLPIARKMGISKELPQRIRAGILDTIQEALGQGDCWVEYQELIERVNVLLIMDCLDSRERIEAELDGLLAEQKVTCADMGGRAVLAFPHLYQQDLFLFFGLERDRDNR